MELKCYTKLVAREKYSKCCTRRLYNSSLVWATVILYLHPSRGGESTTSGQDFYKPGLGRRLYEVQTISASMYKY